MSIRDNLPSAEALLAQRGEITKQLSPLRALYSGNGYFGERVFKQDEAKIETAVRARDALRVKEEGGKLLTEGAVDAVIRQQPEYIDALTKHVQQKQRYHDLEEALNEIEWRLRVRASDSSLLAAETRFV